MHDADDFAQPLDPRALAQYQVVNLNNIGAVCLLAYDTLIQLDREVALVWRSKWTVPKCLYLFARYFGIISQLINSTQWTSMSLSDEVCHHMQLFSGITCQAVVAVVQIILVLRVRAFYMHRIFLRTLLMALLSAGLIAQAVILGLSLSEIIARGKPGRAGCFTLYYPSYWEQYWVPSMALESVLFALVLARVMGVVRRGWGPTSLNVLVTHDGVLYFALLFFALVTNMLLLFFEHGHISQIGVAWLVSLFSISGARMHLNHQEARATLSATPRKKIYGFRFDADLLPAPAQARRRPSPIAKAAAALGIDSVSAESIAGRGVTQDIDTSLDFGTRQSVPARTFDAGALYEPVHREGQEL